MKKEFELIRIPEIQRPKQENPQVAALSPQGSASKMNFHFSYELIEKIKDYAYWEGLTQQQVVTEALDVFLKDKKIKSRPETVKNRLRPGRKPKNS